MTPEEMKRELAEMESAYKKAKWKALLTIVGGLVGLYFSLSRTDMSLTSILLIVAAAALGLLLFAIWLWRPLK